MKLSSQALILLLSIALIQGCNFKTKEATAEEVAAKEKVKTDSIENAATAERTIKRDKLEKAIADKAERRRLAVVEKTSKGESYKDAKGKTVYIKADEMPVYTGGDAEMMKYLKDNLKYPDGAKDSGEEGTVFVDFVVDKTGKVKDVVANDAVNDDVNSLLKNESVRVVSSMPNWKPARNKGKTVDAAYSLPIKFQLL
jgi:TonB family protein